MAYKQEVAEVGREACAEPALGLLQLSDRSGRRRVREERRQPTHRIASGRASMRHNSRANDAERRLRQCSGMSPER